MSLLPKGLTPYSRRRVLIASKSWGPVKLAAIGALGMGVSLGVETGTG